MNKTENGVWSDAHSMRRRRARALVTSIAALALLVAFAASAVYSADDDWYPVTAVDGTQIRAHAPAPAAPVEVTVPLTIHAAATPAIASAPEVQLAASPAAIASPAIAAASIPPAKVEAQTSPAVIASPSKGEEAAVPNATVTGG